MIDPLYPANLKEGVLHLQIISALRSIPALPSVFTDKTATDETTGNKGNLNKMNKTVKM